LVQKCEIERDLVFPPFYWVEKEEKERKKKRISKTS
jgi:hypothetical protein